MSDENNVSSAEIVDTGTGHLEQHEAAETAPDHEAEKEAARKAVKAAIEKAGKDGVETAKKAKNTDGFTPPGVKRDSDGKFAKAEDKDEEGAPKSKPAPKKPEAEDEKDVDPDTAHLKEVLRNRTKLVKQKQAQQQQQQQQQEEFRRQQYEFQRQVQAFQAERKRLEMLRTDPARAVQENGWDPEEFIMNLAQEGTPEGKLQRQLREQDRQIREMHAWREQQLQREQEMQRHHQYQQLAQARQNVEQTFIKGAMNAEKYPHMSDFYGGREQALIAEGDLIAGQYRELTGKEATLEEIADYIEEELAKRAKTWYQKMQKASSASGVQEDETPETTGKPARGGSRGKTLTASAASERRALAKDLRDLDGDERLQAAREAVRVAMAGSSRSTDD